MWCIPTVTASWAWHAARRSFGRSTASMGVAGIRHSSRGFLGGCSRNFAESSMGSAFLFGAILLDDGRGDMDRDPRQAPAIADVISRSGSDQVSGFSGRPAIRRPAGSGPRAPRPGPAVPITSARASHPVGYGTARWTGTGLLCSGQLAPRVDEPLNSPKLVVVQAPRGQPPKLPPTSTGREGEMGVGRSSAGSWPVRYDSGSGTDRAKASLKGPPKRR